MKNALNYHYGLAIDTIHQKQKNYYFQVDNINYLMMPYDNIEEIDEIYKLNVILSNYFPFHQIVLNKQQNVITNINGDNYILLKIFIDKKNIEINDIINLDNINIPLEQKKLRRDNWYQLWTQKVDYFEYQLSQIGKKFPIIRESFNYYVGLAENAITIVSNTNKDNIYLGLSHRRIDNTAFQLYNPLNCIIDLRIRDICEYFKYCFFNNMDIINEVNLFLIYNKLSHEEKRLFLARMLFPTYYFDLYEKIINNEIDEIELKKVISKTEGYEKILKYIYLRFKDNDLNIEWLEN